MKLKLTLSIITTAILVSGCLSKSPTGRSQALLYSNDQMQQMGAQSFETMKQQQKISGDKAKTAYVNCIADRVTSVLPQKQAWEVVLFESDQVNAFALPGGYIGIYTGLLNVATNQHQVATVMGHEVAHVLAQHGNEQVSRAQLTDIGMQAASAALGASGVENQDLYMAGLGLGAQVGILLPFGRDQESEADVVGLELMAQAGFDPAQSIELWKNMANNSGSQGPELLSTHPSHSTRIEDLQSMQAKVQPLYVAAKQQGVKDCRLTENK
ncbi:M48 family metallopeptidase [Shewanella maritima]|uniref:M48 family metallopeptidase n=1 Tax=Shewanella maritima TaxID=2520507 RepID=UPI0037359720